MNDSDKVELTVGDLRRAAAECPEAQRVLAKLKPEAFGVEHKFKVGDRVTCHCPGQGMDGLSGTVRGYGPRSGLPGVQFDRAFAVGHDLDGRCLPGYGWYCHESSLVPEEQWEDVTERMFIRPGLVEGDFLLTAVVRGHPGFPFVIVINGRSDFSSSYKIENGRAYYRRPAK